MLTDKHCKNATCPPDRKQARFTDAGGLYLQVSPAGSKRWFYKYRADGKEKQLALGSYPAVGLADARKARDLAKAQKTGGVDPVAARKVERLKTAIPAGTRSRPWPQSGMPSKCRSGVPAMRRGPSASSNATCTPGWVIPPWRKSTPWSFWPCSRRWRNAAQSRQPTGY